LGRRGGGGGRAAGRQHDAADDGRTLNYLGSILQNSFDRNLRTKNANGPI
jgi:hypothetical protein